LKTTVEHVADHGHAALHPLAAATELGDEELRHGAACRARPQRGAPHRIRRDAVTLRQGSHFLPARGYQLLHEGLVDSVGIASAAAC
jgi:hypothetical protein